MSEAIRDLDEAVKVVSLSGIVYRKPEAYWRAESTRELVHEATGRKLTLSVDRYSYADTITASTQSDYASTAVDALDADLLLMKVARSILVIYNDRRERTKAEREARRKREQEEYRQRMEVEREERRRRAEAKAKVDEARKQRMLTEFMGENVRVRVQGYRSAVKAVVDARPERVYKSGEGYVDTGNYTPFVRYVNYNDYNRPSRVEDIERLEVKVGSRYELVWDDNPDADGSGNRKVGRYDGGLEVS